MKVLRSANDLRLTHATSIEPLLAQGIYDLQVDNHGYYLHSRPGFDLPEKIYGGHDTFADRALLTFAKKREKNQGMAILLSGPKGCGKTLTAKHIAMNAGLPVICLQAGFHGPDFLSWLTELPNPCVIFIDEFEKVYDSTDARNFFLGLLDGASSNRHMFLLTSNAAQIGEYFINRPGRIRYHRRYEELPFAVLQEMINDKVPEDKVVIRAALEKLISELGTISPDSLTCLIEECLMHDDVPDNFMDYFNVEDDLGGSYSVEIETRGYLIKPGLNDSDKYDAKEFINTVNSEGEAYAKRHYGDGLKHCTERIEQWSAKYCMPFQRAYDPAGQSGGYWVSINWADRPGSTSTRQFRFTERDVLKFDRRGDQVYIELRDGTKLNMNKVRWDSARNGRRPTYTEEDY